MAQTTTDETGTQAPADDDRREPPIDLTDPDAVSALADTLEHLGHELLKISARPHKTAVKTLREIAEELIAERKALELLEIVDRATQSLFEATDPDGSPELDLSWEDLSEAQRNPWRLRAVATLRAVGAIEITNEQIDRIAGGSDDSDDDDTDDGDTSTDDSVDDDAGNAAEAGSAALSEPEPAETIALPGSDEDVVAGDLDSLPSLGTDPFDVGAGLPGDEPPF